MFTVLPGTTGSAKSDELERFWIGFLQLCDATTQERNYGTVAHLKRQ